jgi:hypothetical protein
MLKISESLVGFKKDPAVSQASVEDLTKRILDAFHKNRSQLQQSVDTVKRVTPD